MINDRADRDHRLLQPAAKSPRSRKAESRLPAQAIEFDPLVHRQDNDSSPIKKNYPDRVRSSPRDLFRLPGSPGMCAYSPLSRHVGTARRSLDIPGSPCKSREDWIFTPDPQPRALTECSSRNGRGARSQSRRAGRNTIAPAWKAIGMPCHSRPRRAGRMELQSRARRALRV